MKLYTEKEIKRALDNPVSFNMEIDEFIDSLTPIELPSDEEIENESMTNFYPLTGVVGIDHRNNLRKQGFIEGAKWMRDKIQGGNNEQPK